eukprot:CAMPEP_0176496708 /NCGR_PEP_ID=MMETSP0200_2-20121128/11337_1 /TAXON_ID=947934 /ORGANISM="Chaetoceros sp., Strain GSL56" /LENGTH=546 /DNA_ID=CAMNT_0017894677 /DNA_START=42 /DNA_END=1679 /DNA_ORIENTATION=-
MQPVRSIFTATTRNKGNWRTNNNNNIKRISKRLSSSNHVKYHRNSSTSSTITSSTNNCRSKQESSSSSSSSSSMDIIQQLSPRFLRLSSPEYYDPATHQRTDVLFDPTDGRPLQVHVRQDVPSLAEKEKEKYDPSARMRKGACDYVGIEKIAMDNHNETYHVLFKDGHKATFSFDWVKVQVNRLHGGNDHNHDISHKIPRVPWSNMTQEHLRRENVMSISFEDIVLSDDYERYQSRALEILFQYGILLITSTPTNDGGAGVSALASALSGSAYKISPDASSLVHYRKCHKQGITPQLYLPSAIEGPLRTLYGVIWSTHSANMPEGVSLADSSYGNGALPLHTDMTYYRDPPGLQIFTMVSPAQVGGESIFADGLAVAERMRKYHPEEFDVLCCTMRRYRSIDSGTGWYLEASGPVFKAIDRNQNCADPSKWKMGVERWGAVVGIRHNDLDRLPDLPPFHDGMEGDDHDESEYHYYSQLKDAHHALDNLLGSDEFRLEVALKPGETVVVANQRCLHGRKSFLTTKQIPRSIMGCYVSQDDLESRFRW